MGGFDYRKFVQKYGWNFRQSAQKQFPLTTSGEGWLLLSRSLTLPVLLRSVGLAVPI
jgi:hypothetical protein